MRSIESLVDEAQQETGLEDFGPDDWRDGYDRLGDAFEAEARLNEIGTIAVESELGFYLRNRLQIVDWQPRIDRKPIERPIVVIGQARTGTTILHDLLGQDPRHRVPISWEVDRPVPPPEEDTYETDPRIEQVAEQQNMIELVIPDFRAMHPLGPLLAQECVRITGSAFRSFIFGTQYRMPSYTRWVFEEADMAPAYRWHRMYLEHLQSRFMRDRWVLKSPCHIWCLDALLAEYPDALLIQTHRDPMRILGSICSLISYLRRVCCDDPTIEEVAAEWAEYVLVGLDRSVDARENGVVKPEQVVDVQFGDFMSDEIGTIRSIYEKFAIELTSEAEGRMRAFLASHQKDAHGTHTYSFADTGLDEGEIRERSRRYCEYFAVV